MTTPQESALVAGPPDCFRVREGNTGILQLGTGPESRRFIPNCDEDAARSLLLEFQELQNSGGVPLKSNYRAEGFNWYPTTVSFLYWYVFLPFVKYEPLVREWAGGKARFHWDGGGSFRTLIELLADEKPKRPLKMRLHYLLMKWSNRVVLRRSPADLLFFRFARKDFRTVEIRKALDTLGVRYLDVVPAPSIRELLSSLLRGGRDYCFTQPPAMNRGNRFGHSYPLDHLDPLKRKLFAAAIRAVETSITSCLVEYHDHERALRRCKASTFYGLDDVNGYVFPILYACRTRGMRTIGHQHGAYVKRHAAYRMEGIEAGEFVWFDHVIVWGEYWREKMRRDSTAYPPDFFIVGSNKFSSFPSSGETRHRHPKTVLIPYEFLANTAKIGKYMQKLLDLGYRVAFKPRPDDDLDEQLEAYCLPASYRERLTIMPKLDEAALAEIDIVAGTMTTLLYELLPCNKVIWVLDTEFHHLDDLVEEHFAVRVRLADLDKLDDSFFRPTRADAVSLFGKASLEETLRDHVLRAGIEPNREQILPPRSRAP